MCILVQLLLAATLQAPAEGEALWQAGKRLEALDAMAAELTVRPEDRVLRLRLVERELELSRFQGALAHARPLGPAGRGAIGRALYFLGRYAEALEYLSRDQADEVLLAVESLRALGRIAEADSLLPRVRGLWGSEHPAYRLLKGRKLLREGDGPGAALEFEAVLARAPLEAEAHFGLGRALLASGKRAAALAQLERHRRLMPLLDRLDFARHGLALAPGGPANQAALGDALRALLDFDLRLKQTGLPGEARAAYARAFAGARGADLVPIALRAARFEVEVLDRPDLGLALLEEALLRHEAVRLRVRAADLCGTLAEYARARAHLETALHARPSDQSIQQRLAELNRAKEVK